ncbi:hypothetical protein HDU76_002732, partial [Blyttiomyces sp. JEL0837]
MCHKLTNQSVVEPVKRAGIEFYEAKCDKIDLANKEVHCTTTLEDFHDTFTAKYDMLVIATGAISNTYNIPGVDEFALPLKDVGDARRIRTRIMECFEHASQPNVPACEKAAVLHFVTVGGGPTGVEFTAELHDFITEDVLKLYPDLKPYVKMTVFDVGKRILGSFNNQLADYASRKFASKGIEIRLQQQVKQVSKGNFTLSTGEIVPYGLLVWSTGLSALPLIKALPFMKDQGIGRLVTDEHLRVLTTVGTAVDNVFALGDCGTINELPLPCTAQVANQKAVWLRKALNSNKVQCASDITNVEGFHYHHMGSLAYIGKWKALVDTRLPSEAEPKSLLAFVPNTGVAAWLFWRSAYFTMSVSWKNK